jgi:hypothetical protein
VLYPLSYWAIPERYQRRVSQHGPRVWICSAGILAVGVAQNLFRRRNALLAGARLIPTVCNGSTHRIPRRLLAA